MISTDSQALESGSAVSRRLRAYAEKFDAMDVIVLSEKKGELNESGLRVRSTASSSPLLRGLHALLIARGLPQPDAVTVQDPFENGLVGWFIARYFNAPLHVQVHTNFLTSRFVSGNFLNRIRRVIAWFVLRRAARIRVVSDSIKEVLEERGFREVNVLPIFVDVQKYAELTRTKHPRFKIALLWIGRLEKEKNCKLAIEALKAARTAGHDAGLTIVGSGSEEKTLKTQVRVQGLERFVEFAGRQENLTPYFSAADLVLVTSRYEGYGMVIIESLAAGIPVLATDAGVAREAGAIVTTANEFPDALKQWISNGARRAELANYPYHSFEEYVRLWCEDIEKSSR